MSEIKNLYRPLAFWRHPMQFGPQLLDNPDFNTWTNFKIPGLWTTGNYDDYVLNDLFTAWTGEDPDNWTVNESVGNIAPGDGDEVRFYKTVDGNLSISQSTSLLQGQAYGIVVKVNKMPAGSLMVTFDEDAEALEEVITAAGTHVFWFTPNVANPTIVLEANYAGATDFTVGACIIFTRATIQDPSGHVRMLAVDGEQAYVMRSKMTVGNYYKLVINETDVSDGYLFISSTNFGGTVADNTLSSGVNTFYRTAQGTTVAIYSNAAGTTDVTLNYVYLYECTAGCDDYDMPDIADYLALKRCTDTYKLYVDQDTLIPFQIISTDPVDSIVNAYLYDTDGNQVADLIADHGFDAALTYDTDGDNYIIIYDGTIALSSSLPGGYYHIGIEDASGNWWYSSRIYVVDIDNCNLLKVTWSNNCNIDDTIYDTGWEGALYLETGRREVTCKVDREVEEVSGESYELEVIIYQQYSFTCKVPENIYVTLCKLVVMDNVSFAFPDGVTITAKDINISDELVDTSDLYHLVIEFRQTGDTIAKTGCCNTGSVSDSSSSI